MNTRVQVEHCVTEMTTGIDIVKEGIRVAAGEPLSVAQDDVVLRGHAIECRINAEDASKTLRARAGTDRRATSSRRGPGVRVDSGVRAGSEISPMYDPMVAKLIVWDVDREQATRRMLRALAEYEIEGLKTLIPFHRALLASEQWARGETCRDLLEDRDWLKALAFETAPKKAGDDAGETVEQTYTVEVSGRKFDVRVIGPPGAPASAADGSGSGSAPAPRRPARAAREATARENGHGSDALASPMQGNVWKIPVKDGQQVVEGDVVTIIEAMKMENEITAHKAGVIAELPISEGDLVRSGDVLAVIADLT